MIKFDAIVPQIAEEGGRDSLPLHKSSFLSISQEVYVDSLLSDGTNHAIILNSTTQNFSLSHTHI